MCTTGPLKVGTIRRHAFNNRCGVDTLNVKSIRIGRNELWWLTDNRGGHGDAPGTVAEIEGSIYGHFRFVEGGPEAPGMRAPQLGALHAILAAQSLDPEPVTIVLPTGTGKTDTMLAAYSYRPRRTLVVVPSDALRTQIGRKFATLGVLPEVGALEGDFLAPTVAIVRSRLESAEQVQELLDRACVVVATAAALSRGSEQANQALVDIVEQLFVDEAHHVAAPTWQRIVTTFQSRRIVQFTATPFREDGQRLGGRIAYAYPLRLAQANGWFAKINYRAVSPVGDVDRALACAAVEQLRADLDAGKDHILMARVQAVARADDLVKVYEDIAPDLQPVRIDSKLSARRQRDAKGKLDDRRSRVVICVDMLGEGFDLPALKIAALHDPHKSLAVTLQFVGRFTRSGGEQLGDASVFVPRTAGLLDERLRHLYGEDADWNTVIRDLSHAEVEYQQVRNEFEAGFNHLPPEVAIRGVQPKMSTVVYRSPQIQWQPEEIHNVFDEASLLTSTIAVNSREHVAWFVTAERAPVRWGDFSTFTEVVHHLYVLHADMQRGLLYINSSNNDQLHQELAKAVGGDQTELIRGDVVYRVLAPITRRVPTNVGLLDTVNRNRRFSMHVGADVLEGFRQGAAQKAKTNIFAHGYLDQSRTSFGASRKGRIWSHKVAGSIFDWVRWARQVGEVITDESIRLEDVMNGFIIPKAATSRPELSPLGVEWPHELGLTTSESRQVSFQGAAHPLIDLDLILRTFDRDALIEFDVSSEDWSLRYAFTFDEGGPKVVAVGADATITQPKGESMGLAEFMTQVGMSVYFEGEALLTPDGYLLQPDRTRPRFPRDRLEVIDWTGTNIRKESQGPDRDPESVQFRVAQVLQAENEWEVVLDDDGSGELADLVFIRRDEQRLELLMAHCKYSSEDQPGARINDLYEVCGQAAKSHKARADIALTLRRLIRREQMRIKQGRSGLILGSLGMLLSIHDECWRFEPYVTVAIAQPGLSCAGASNDQSELLGCIDLFVSETYGSRFRVLCSP